MRNPVLATLLFCFSAVGYAQTPAPLTGPWREVNIYAVGGGTYTNELYAMGQLVALSPTFTWALAYDAQLPTGNPVRNKSVRAINATGTDFDFNDIVGTPGFEATNITVPAGTPNNATAFCGQFRGSGAAVRGGEVIRTTSGGLTWRKISSAQMFAAPNGSCAWAYAFDANAVVAAGDPTPAAGGPNTFEFWYTANASTPSVAAVAWTRASAPAPLDAGETLRLEAYAAVGNTMWAGTSHTASGVPGPCRVLRSTDQGHTWTAHATPMVGEIQHIAFKDALHGLAYTHHTGTSSTLMTTADGGLTWTPQTLPDPTTADTVRGKFYWFGVAAIPNIGFMSFGATGQTGRLPDYGASFSCDGVGKSWTDVEKARSFPNRFSAYFSASFLQSGSNGYSGYFGGVTASTVLLPGLYDPGGFFQVNAGATAPACVLPTRSASALPLLPATPNPSPDGVFQLALPAGLGAGAEVTVSDALGRVVLRHALADRATGSLRVDLSQQRPGLYTLRLSTPNGTAVQKLVVD